jgi:hypothetical protein
MSIKDRLFLWNNMMKEWPFVKHQFAHFTKPIGGYLLPFLEGFFSETYGDALKEVTDVLRRAKYNIKDVPLAAFIVVQAEKIEPLVREKLIFMKQTKIFTKLEHERTRTDYLVYLLTSNAEESRENFILALNREVAFIGKLLLGLYGKNGLKPLVLEYIARALTQTDIAAKQFVIVATIYLESTYRQRFLPEQVDAEHPIRVKPRRFLYFVKEILPERFRKLKTGVFSGLLEFMNDVRPAYCMID